MDVCSRLSNLGFYTWDEVVCSATSLNGDPKLT